MCGNGIHVYNATDAAIFTSDIAHDHGVISVVFTDDIDDTENITVYESTFENNNANYAGGIGATSKLCDNSSVSSTDYPFILLY